MTDRVFSWLWSPGSRPQLVQYLWQWPCSKKVDRKGAGVSPAGCLPLPLRVWGPHPPRTSEGGATVVHRSPNCRMRHVWLMCFVSMPARHHNPQVGPTRCHQAILSQQNGLPAEIWQPPPVFPIPAGPWWVLTSYAYWSLVWVLKFNYGGWGGAWSLCLQDTQRDETEGCTEMLATQQGHGACSDSQDLRWFSLPLCDSCFMTVYVQSPRFVLCLTDKFWEMADNKITWEYTVDSKLGTEFWRKLHKNYSLFCVWERIHTMCVDSSVGKWRSVT